MRVLLGRVLGAAAVLAVASVAIAADMPVEAPVTEFGSNWYLRGDIGYKFYTDPNVSFNDRIVKVGPFKNEHIDSTGVVGGGVGYKINEWFRTDLTVDYEWDSDWRGRAPCGGCAGKNKTSKEWAKVSAWTFLANGYVDLGTWNAITPYVGAGVGASNIRISDYHFRNPNGVKGSWPNGDAWSFSWAAMAGLSYAVSDNFLVDLNYRYLSLGDGESGKVKIGTGRSTVHFDDLAAHEVRIGFRYLID